MRKSQEKAPKHEYWQDQIKKWETSKSSQSEFCKQAGIRLSTFVYWRCKLMKAGNKPMNKFAQIKIIKDTIPDDSGSEIRIKLMTGHVVHLPAGFCISKTAKLIQLLGFPHA